MKLFCLGEGVLAGVAGDAEAGVRFLGVVYRDLLKRSPTELPTILEEVAGLVDPSGHAFQVFISCGRGVESRLYTMDHQGLLAHLPCQPQTVCSLGGSMPAAQRQQIADLVGMLDGQVPAQLAQMACLALIQTFGVYDVLMPLGFGGAVFCAAHSTTGIRWQAPISYVFLGPDETDLATVVDVRQELNPVTLAGASKPVNMGFVRTLIQQECGIPISTLAEPALRIFVPPTWSQGDEGLERLLAAHPKPYQAIRADDHVALVNRKFRKIILLDRDVVETQSHILRMYQWGDLTGGCWPTSTPARLLLDVEEITSG